MKAIKDEIKLELQREHIDELYLNTLIGLDKLGEMNIDFFRGSARMYSRTMFRKERPKARLFDSCDVVIRYMGGFYIQHLNSGFYMIDLNDNAECDEVSTIFMNMELSAVEEVLWNTKAYKSFIKPSK